MERRERGRSSRDIGRQNKGQMTNMRKMFVGNLTYSVQESDLHALFSRYGEIVSIRVIERKGYGFIEMETVAEAEAARRALNEVEFQGRNLLIDGVRPPRKQQNKHEYQQKRPFKNGPSSGQRRQPTKEGSSVGGKKFPSKPRVESKGRQPVKSRQQEKYHNLKKDKPVTVTREREQIKRRYWARSN